MLLSPKSIANFFLDLARARGEKISPMKLQKLVYYAHGWFAGYTGRPLINESVEAWQYGPVIPSLYREFKRFGSGDITAKACGMEGLEYVEVPAPQDESMRKFLTSIWDSYGKYTGITLSEMTHAAGSPWDEAWKANQGVRGVDIPFESIATHFRAAVEKANQNKTQA
ncbi:MAG TPA: type II toxin-antitoxin system antitoxin SocA domain-containing protein [Burkholderiaceae bacterium]|nr:type II toxin-antitoxin system antitoxin SocA domain-containing protein [Burkholderiaceae bacterium]